MFGSRPSSEPSPFDNEGYSPTHEYLAVAYFGIGAFNEGVDEMARKGWELVNGCMAGTAHYAYLRRALKSAPASGPSGA